jgi:hypothetical protein
MQSSAAALAKLCIRVTASNAAGAWSGGSPQTISPMHDKFSSAELETLTLAGDGES